MPNWCSNRLKISGSPDQITLLKTKFQNISGQQQKNALRMVIIHCWYIFIHKGESMDEDSKIMDVYERILDICNNEKMTLEICTEVRNIFFELALTVEKIGEEKLDVATKETLLRICSHSKGDFLGWGNNDTSEDTWNQFLTKANTLLEEEQETKELEKDNKKENLQFDFGVFRPPMASHKVNGFNGRIFDSIKKEAGDTLVEDFPTGGGYGGNVANWGTKWNAGSAYFDIQDDNITIDFDTAWSPPTPVIYSISEQFPDLMFEHIYAEQGANYCGVLELSNGCISREEEGELEWSETENEDDWPEVVGPEYILELEHFGG